MQRIVLWALMLTLSTAAFAAPNKALVKVAAACFRSQPAHSAELETQATYGTPLQIIEQRGQWSKVEMPDGYKAWVTNSSITPCSNEQFHKWQHAKRLIVTNPYATVAYADSLCQSPANAAFDTVLGAIFEGSITPGASFVKLTTPDGRHGFVPKDNVSDFEEWSKRPHNINTILETAASMCGISYLWGGTTTKALDCSGFTKVCYGAAGLILLRNASQQADSGLKLNENNTKDFKPGDLLFFGNDNGRITHVALYEGNDVYIHSSGRVHRSSHLPGHKLYLSRRVIAACRILGVENPRGVVAYKNHTWYFSK